MKSYTVEEALKEIGVDVKNLSESIVAKAKNQIQALAIQTHALIVEKAQTTLKSTRQTYLDNLTIAKLHESSDQIIWSVGLKKDAGWIEDGFKPGPIIDRVLNGGKPPKKAKDGSSYKIIPFKHNKAPAQQSAAQLRLARYAKNEIKKQGLDKVITDKQGRPVIGRAASVSIKGKDQPTGRFNQPLLAGLTIYQREQKLKSGKSKIVRDVMTFRVISSKHHGTGMWETKGYKGLRAFEEVQQQIDRLWNDMMRDLLK